MCDTNNCDSCGKVDHSIDLFWNIPFNEHTKRQLKVIDLMNSKGFDAVCLDCFYKLSGGTNE